MTVDHITNAISRLAQQFKDKPRIVSLLTDLASPAISLEAALQRLLVERTVNTAIGAQLDAIGYIVGQIRAGESDDVYRRFVRARIMANRSRGTVDDLIRLSSVVIYDEDIKVTVLQQGIAAVVIRIDGDILSAEVANILIRFLQDAVSAGVRIILESYSVSEANIFTFDSLLATQAFYDGGIGGSFADARDRILSTMIPDIILPHWPVSAAELFAAAGYGTWASIWAVDEESGNLSDSVGGVTLTAFSSPVYRLPGAFTGDFAVGFNSVPDRFEGSTSTYNLTAPTSIAVYLSIYCNATGASQPIIGKGILSADAWWGIGITAAGYLTATVSDNVTSVTTTVTSNHVIGRFIDCVMVIDRTAQRMLLQSEMGASPSADISTVGNPSNTRPFHLGGPSDISTALTSTIAFAAIATGDVTALRTNAGTAITNMRTFTSRPIYAWPTTAAAMNAAFGWGTWSNAWLCEDASGNLLDAIGSVPLLPTGTPLYRQAGAFLGDYAIGFSAGTTSKFAAASASTFDLNATTSLALYLCIRPSTISNVYFAGKVGAAPVFWSMVMQPGGEFRVQLYDGASSITATISIDHNGAYRDVLAVIDRTSQRLQLFTSLGASPEVNISAVGTMVNAVPFAIGAASSSVFANSVAFAAVATGDIPNLRANGVAALAAIRAWTGR